MKRVLLDTNAIMAIMELKIDPFEQLQQLLDIPFKIYVIQGSITELEQLQGQGKHKVGRAAKLGLQILRAKNIPILPEEGIVDDILAEHSQQGDLILTQDIGLKRRLAKPYLTIRQKKRIMMVE